jgi:hypothetical protein
MRPFFSYGVKEIVAACLLSGCIAGGIVAMTSPGAAGGSAPVAVDRSNKTDRLPQGVIIRESAERAAQPSKENANAPKSDSSRRTPPLGCDPSFSPVAEPDRAHVFNRCMV